MENAAILEKASKLLSVTTNFVLHRRPIDSSLPDLRFAISWRNRFGKRYNNTVGLDAGRLPTASNRPSQEKRPHLENPFSGCPFRVPGPAGKTLLDAPLAAIV